MHKASREIVATDKTQQEGLCLRVSHKQKLGSERNGILSSDKDGIITIVISSHMNLSIAKLDCSIVQLSSSTFPITVLGNTVQRIPGVRLPSYRSIYPMSVLPTK